MPSNFVPLQDILAKKRNYFNIRLIVFIMEMFKLEINGSNECYYFFNSDNMQSCKENHP